jgi:hypothetical protein
MCMMMKTPTSAFAFMLQHQHKTLRTVLCATARRREHNAVRTVHWRCASTQIRATSAETGNAPQALLSKNEFSDEVQMLIK